jgi:alanine-glyoxylate transaminase/serine-glyoxylate transaminase/serine-pyruvate transaminase
MSAAASALLPGELKPGSRLLLGPGPSEADPRVLKAMSTPLLGHLDPEFLLLMSETQGMLRQVFGTANLATLPMSGTGMAGMECVVVNLIEPGDRMVVCAAGYFGGRMAEIARRAGADVTVLEAPWGEAVDISRIIDTAKRVRPKVVGVVHAETSTGVLQPLEGLGRALHEQGALLAVDAVTSLGCVPVEVDAWELDAVYSGTQKGLGCPPGLSPVTFSPRALEAIRQRKTKVQSWYLDLSEVLKYWSEERFYHHTAPISAVYALREGLRIVLEEGLPARFARHQLHHRALKAGLTALGLAYANKEGCRLPQLNPIAIPAGVDDVRVRKRLVTDFGIEIGGGLGEFKGKVWRIGLMGYSCRAAAVFSVLAALEQCLLGEGVKTQAGAGVAAAQQVYAGEL